MTAKPIPVKIPPGVVLGSTEYEAQGRYIKAEWVRFFDGAPSKIGGWEQWNTPGEELDGIPRSILCWQDFGYNLWHAFGTSHRLWVYDQDKARTNITPIVSSGQLTNPFSTTDTDTTVNVADTAHGLVVDQWVYFDNASAVGGITIDGWYQVTAIVSADAYQIEHSSPATSTAGPGGGTVDYQYEMAEGNTSASLGGGWGLGTWGSGTWGTERASATYLTLPRYWSLDKYGQYLIAQVSDGRLYEWQVNTANRAALVANSPTSGLFAFVTSERIIVVLGAGGDFMRVDWCDDDNNTIWTPAADNTANTRKLQEGSRLIAGTRLGQQINMIWSDTAAYLMQWLGNNFVYSIRVIGTNSGIMGPGAFVVVHGTAFWMSQRTFHMSNGSSVQHVPNAHDVESIFDSINEAQRHKIHAHVNLAKREVWWLYPAGDATECDRYVMVNLEDFTWGEGPLERTCAGGRVLNGVDTILATDVTGVIYEHETGVNADGEPLDWQLETGYFDLESGGVGLNIDGYIPDFNIQAGDIDLTWTSRDYPESSAALETVTETIAEGQDIVDLRHYGRQCKFKLSQTDVLDGNFELGLQRIEVGQSGSRR